MGEVDCLLDAALNELDKLRFNYKTHGASGAVVSQAEGVESIIERLCGLIYIEGEAG